MSWYQSILEILRVGQHCDIWEITFNNTMSRLKKTLLFTCSSAGIQTCSEDPGVFVSGTQQVQSEPLIEALIFYSAVLPFVLGLIVNSRVQSDVESKKCFKCETI